MDELFKKFERGEIPNFIELMAAISELADYWPVDICLDCRPAKISPQNAENTSPDSDLALTASF